MRQNSARRVTNGFPIRATACPPIVGRQVHRDQGHQVNRQHLPGFVCAARRIKPLDGRSRRSPARLVARLPYNYHRCVLSKAVGTYCISGQQRASPPDM